MSLPSRTRLGAYEIVALIGTGGMGEVYRARDSRLGRDVAIKVLPEELATDSDQLARLEREARMLAALNHPNIATIHGIEESAGARALVMELVDGETLEFRIARSRLGSRRGLKLAEVLSIAKPITEALAAAHDKGIVHRDLKPANVKITSEGIVKVLDFGLAKVTTPSWSSPTAGLPTVAADATRAGTLLGTPTYMSPEQARGEAADARADIWAFGCVLYEMLTGLRAFDGESYTETLAHVLEREPDFTALPATTPPSIRRLLRRCLEKDPKKRLRHIGDARFELDDAADASPESHPATTARASGRSAGLRAALWVAAGLFVGGIGAAFALRFAAAPPVSGVTRFSIALPAHFELRELALSPDGRTLVYSANDHTGTRLYRRALDALDPEPIRGSEGGRSPHFSPDGASISFWVDQTLRSLPLAGGIARTLYARTLFEAPRDAPSHGLWLSDQTMVFGSAASIMRVPLAGGPAQRLAELDRERGEVAHFTSEALPDDSAVLFTAHYGAQDTQRVQMLSLQTGERRDLIQGNGASFVPPGDLVFQRGGSLWIAPFDPKRMEVTGSAREVVKGVAVGSAWQPLYAIAGNGTLAYARGTEPYPPRTLVWVDEAGAETPLDAPARAWWWPHVSPDGRRLGLHIMDPVNMDAWIYELDHGPLIRMSYDPRQDGYPLWSPDDAQIAYWSRKAGGPPNIYLRSADLTGEDRRITAVDTFTNPVAWTPDGKQLLFQQQSPDTGIDIGLVSVDGAAPGMLLIAGRADECKPQLSPDGRWIAYESNVSGRWEIYVQSFPGLDGRWQLSTMGGAAPLWSADGTRLYYRQERAVLSVPVDTTGGTFKHGNPRVLFEGDYVPEDHEVADVGNYALARDTGRFLMMKQEQAAPTEIIVIVNWADENKKRTP